MEVILQEDIIGLGEEGDIKNVATGYARNYLIPKGFALLKNTNNLKRLERIQSVIIKRKEEKSFAAKSLADKLEGMDVTVSGKVSDGTRLYGSIHTHQIAEVLKEKDIEIDQRRIELGHPIKMLGDYDIVVKCYEGIQAVIKLHVISNETPEKSKKAAVKDKKDEDKETVETSEVVMNDKDKETVETAESVIKDEDKETVETSEAVMNDKDKETVETSEAVTNEKDNETVETAEVVMNDKDKETVETAESVIKDEDKKTAEASKESSETEEKTGQVEKPVE